MGTLSSRIAKAFQRNIAISANLWAKAVFVVVWASLTLGFIFSDKLLFLGGGFGYVISNSLQALIGGVGLLALLVLSFTGFIFIIFKFKIFVNIHKTSFLLIF